MTSQITNIVGIEVLVLRKARREPELRGKRGKSCDHRGSSYVNKHILPEMLYVRGPNRCPDGAVSRFHHPALLNTRSRVLPQSGLMDACNR